jgi:hypothetical protein
VPYLEEQRAVSEGGTTFYALGATNAESLIDVILIVRIFYEGSLDCPCWAKLVFGARFQNGCSQLKITGTEIAISANLIKLDAFDSGIFQYTKSCASVTSYALIRIDLPHKIVIPLLMGRGAGNNTKSSQASSP